MKSIPFFSIIIPTYNRLPFLKIALGSALNQNFTDYELIIADDGSTDKTKDFIHNLDYPCLRYFYQKNSGPASARNLGIKKAKGKYICFLDSDDRFRKDKLKITYQHIKQNPSYKIFHSQEIWYRNGKLLRQKKRHKKPTGFVFANAARLCSVSISTAAIKKEIFSDIGNFDPKLPACEDYEFWLRATSRYPVYLINDFLTIKEGGHPAQQSKKYPAMDEYRIYALTKIIDSNTLNKKQYKIASCNLKDKCLIYIKGAKKRGKTKKVKKYQDILNKYCLKQ